MFAAFLDRWETELEKIPEHQRPREVVRGGTRDWVLLQFLTKGSCLRVFTLLSILNLKRDNWILLRIVHCT